MRKALSILVLVALLTSQFVPIALAAGPPEEKVPRSNVRTEPLKNQGWPEVTVSQLTPLESQVKHVPDELVAAEAGPTAQTGASDESLLAVASTSYSLVAAPEYLNFYAVENGANPASQKLRLRNAGGGTLNYAIQEDIDWLSVSSTSGSLNSETDTITIAINKADLQAGDSPFVDTITIEDLGDPANTRQVRVRLSLDTVDRRTTLYSYDSNGNLQRRIDANGAVVDYEYDSLNRLTRIAYPDGSSVSYTYDTNGNRTSMTDSWGTTNYSYDDYNRLTEVDFPNVNPVKYEYDLADNLTKITYPNGTVVNYGYDADNRLTTVTDASGTTTYGYDATSGNLASKTLPNGVTTTYGYDADGRLTDVTNKGPGSALISSYHYTLDDNGMRTAVEKTTPGGTKTTTYSYDALNRLDRVTYPDGRTVRYEYDEAGNRLKMITPEGTTNYTYDADNRLLQAGDEGFFYDRSGNLTTRVVQTRTIRYSYDYENRLTRYSDGETVVQFVYDGDGNRIAKIVDGARTNYVNDVNGLLTQVLLEADASWQADKTYTLGLDRISQQEVGADPSFYLYDSPGRSVTGVADNSGALVNTYGYDAFGAMIAQTGDINNVYTYNGEQNDTETNLIYLRRRYYDPAMGRFLSRDPVAGFQVSPQTVNPYSYVLNNPVNFTDPSGEFIWPAALTFLIYASYYVSAHPDTVIGAVTGAYGGYTEGKEWGKTGSRAGRFVRGLGGAVLGGIEGAISPAPPGFESNLVTKTYDVISTGYGHIADWVTKGSRKAIDWIDDLLKSSDDNRISFGNHMFPLGKADDLHYYFPPPPPPGGDLGGVSLDLTADLMLQIDDIAGATYDEKSGQVVFFGQEDVTLPEMDLDDLAVAVHSVFGGQDPGVSIDPPVVGGQFSVRYEGETRETEFGWVMFEADRVMKILSLGRDNITGQPVTSSVPGYQSMLDRYLASGECNPGESSTRFWFRPKEVRLVKSDSGSSMVFDAVSMEVLTESKFEGGVVSDPEAEAFADHFTQHYDEFAQEFPILKDLKRLGKIVAVVKWIKDNDIPMDVSFLDNYAIEFYPTPDQTPSIIVQGDNGVCIITLEGGVTYEPPNEYLADDPQNPVTEATSTAALAQRPTETQFSWNFSQDGQNYTAVAQSLARSPKDGNFVLAQTDMSFPVEGDFSLNLTRYYDSFWDKPTSFSFGWAETPFALRFPLYRQTFTFSGGSLQLDLYEQIFVLERPQGREDSYTLLGLDGSNRPLYERDGSADLLRGNTDGTFTLLKKDQSQIWFNASGQFIAFVDSNGNQVDYTYTGGRLTNIAHASGRQITLSYDGQDRINRINGPGGRQVTYTYDGAGNLSSVTNQASGQQITYTYDADRHLIRAVDNRGNIIFDQSYDEYGRTPQQTFGQDAPFDFDYDLGSRNTVVTDPFGSQTRLEFDEQYRLLGRTNALGYVTSLAYAGDFGPSSFTDVHGATTQYEYDIGGNVRGIIDDQGGRTDLYYDAASNLVAMEDPTGVQTAFGYDANSNLTTIYHEVELVFDAGGNLTSFLFNPNNLTEFSYDSNGNLLTVTDPESNSRDFSYDSFGMVDRVQEASGLETSYSYDGLSRLQRITRGSSNITFGYDNADNLTSISTAAGGVAYGYDDNNNLADITDAEGNHTHFDYDQDNNLIQVVDAASKVTQYGYDALGNLTSITLPNDTVVTYEYDELGRPVRVSSGEIISRSPPLGDNEVYLPIILKNKS